MQNFDTTTFNILFVTNRHTTSQRLQSAYSRSCFISGLEELGCTVKMIPYSCLAEAPLNVDILNVLDTPPESKYSLTFVEASIDLMSEKVLQNLKHLSTYFVCILKDEQTSEKTVNNPDINKLFSHFLTFTPSAKTKIGEVLPIFVLPFISDRYVAFDTPEKKLSKVISKSREATKREMPSASLDILKAQESLDVLYSSILEGVFHSDLESYKNKIAEISKMELFLEHQMMHQEIESYRSVDFCIFEDTHTEQMLNALKMICANTNFSFFLSQNTENTEAFWISHLNKLNVSVVIPESHSNTQDTPTYTLDVDISKIIELRNQLLFKHSARIRLRQLLNAILNSQGELNFDDLDTQYVPSAAESIFYKKFFNKGRDINVDEYSRLQQIYQCLELAASIEGRRKLKLVDAGCGRGWLTHFSSRYGDVVGFEPVPETIGHAKNLYPDLHFEVATPFLMNYLGHSGKYDVCVCSEVIEHVPDLYKEAFVIDLKALLKATGYIVLTTPRGERYDEWMSKYGNGAQPTEAWISETDLKSLMESQGFEALYKTRAGYFSDIYQVWLFKKL